LLLDLLARSSEDSFLSHRKRAPEGLSQSVQTGEFGRIQSLGKLDQLEAHFAGMAAESPFDTPPGAEDVDGEGECAAFDPLENERRPFSLDDPADDFGDLIFRIDFDSYTT
jgi:hypothetical protein